jgi:hypothetical protein
MASKEKDLNKKIINLNLAEDESRLENKGWYISQEPETSDELLLFPHRIITKETSLERIERKIDSLMRDVATRDDLIAQTTTLLENQKILNEELIIKLQTLRTLQINNVAHKRLARYATIFLVFFSISFLMRIFVNITVVTPFWNNVGLLLSCGFLLMSWALKKDWKNDVGSGD